MINIVDYSINKNINYISKGGNNLADLGEENKVSGVFGGVQLDNEQSKIENAGTIRNNNLPTKVGFWSNFKAFWLQEID